jgi:hypothetical protein
MPHLAGRYTAGTPILATGISARRASDAGRTLPWPEMLRERIPIPAPPVKGTAPGCRRGSPVLLYFSVNAPARAAHGTARDVAAVPPIRLSAWRHPA